MLARSMFTKWFHPNHKDNHLVELRKGQFMSINLPAFSGIRVLSGLGWFSSEKKAVALRGGDEYWTSNPIVDARISAEGDRRLTFETVSDWLIATHENARVAVTVMSIRGCLDWTTYEMVIERGQQLFQAGTEYLLIDLREVSVLTNAGLVALHNLSRIIGGAQPTDLEDGWSALHAIAADCQKGYQTRIKLLSPQEVAQKALEHVGLSSLFEIHSSMDTALRSF